MLTTDTRGRRYLLAEYADKAATSAAWRYEAPDGETYMIECIEGHWRVSRDIWLDCEQEWEGELLAISVDAFLKEHNIAGLVS